jgi:hypothetical protein
MYLYAVLRINHIYADPDPTFRFEEDPDPTFQSYAYPDPNF